MSVAQVKLKEATIHFYYLFDESHFWDIWMIIELNKLNWLCKHMKNVRSSQPSISMNFFSKAQVLPCDYHEEQPAIYDRAFLQKTSWGNADKYFYKQAPSSM